jgi:hypothetical protein
LGSLTFSNQGDGGKQAKNIEKGWPGKREEPRDTGNISTLPTRRKCPQKE